MFTGIAWSLCFEEQFYALCCLTLAFAPRRWFPLIGVATALILAVRVYAWWIGGLSGLKGTFPLLWHQFAVGLAVYYFLSVSSRDWERRLMVLSLAALLIVGLATHGDETLTASAFGLILIAFRRWDAVVSTAWLLTPFRTCGRRCYSIYLAHLPLSVAGNHWLYEWGVTTFWGRALVMIPLASLAGVAAGWAFHAAIETRFLNSPPRLRGRIRFSRRTKLAGA